MSEPGKPAEHGAQLPAAEGVGQGAGAGPARRPERPPRRRRWARVLGRTLLGLVALAVVVRLALPFALPGILRSWAEERGLALTYGELDVGILAGSVELWHADLRPLPASPRAGGPDAPIDPEESLAHLEYFELDAAMLALLRGELKVRRLEIDGVDVLARRGDDGTWEVQQYLARAGTEAEEEEEPAAEEPEEVDGEDGPLTALEPLIGLLRRLEVSALRIQHLNLRVQDPTVAPPVDARLELSVRLSDVGSTARRARLQVVALAPGVMDSLRVVGDATVREDTLAIDARVDLLGLRPPALAGYLRPLGLEPRGRELSLGATASVRLRDAAPEDSDGLHLAGSLEVTDVAVTADREEAFGLDRFAVSLAALRAAEVHLDRVEVRGLRARAARDEDGAVVVAGLALGAAPGGARDAGGDDPEPGGEAGDGAAPLALRLDVLQAGGFELALDDRAVAPATRLALELRELTVADVVLDPARPGEPLRIELAAAVPDVARAVRASGTATPTGARRGADLQLDVEGLAPARLDPYLAAAGLTAALEDGVFRARLAAQVERAEADGGGLRASASVSGVALTAGGGERELLALDELAVRDVLLTAAETRVPALVVAGPRASVERDEEGRWHVLGLRTLDAEERSLPGGSGGPGGPGRAGAPQEPAGADGGGERAREPARHRIVLERVALEGASLALRDRALEPELALAIGPVTAELAGLVLGGSPDAPAPPPATVELLAAAEGLAGELEVAGTIASRPGPLDVDVALTFSGRGLTARAVEPYLRAAGVEPQRMAAELDGELRAAARADGDATVLDAAVRGVRLVDGGDELVGLDALELVGLRVAPGETTIAELALLRPRLRAARDAEGALLALGLRVLPPPPAPAPPAAPAGPDEDAAAAEQAGAAPGARFALRMLRVEGATVQWSDAAVEPAAETALTASASLADLVLGAAESPVRVEAEVGLAGALDALTLAAEASLDPDDLRVDATVEARGLRAGPLAGYFPPGVASTLTDGRFALALEARSAPAAEGGRDAFLAVRGLDYREAEADEPFLALESFALEASRLDPAAGVYELARLSNAGLRLAARRTAERRFEALGLAFEPPPPSPAAPEVPGSAEPGDDAGGAPAGDAAAGAAAAEPPASGDAGRRPGEAFARRVTLGEVDLGLERFAFADGTRADAVPLELAARVATPGPQVVLDEDPEALPPLALAVTASAAPIVGSARVDVTATPWAPEPGLALEIALSGLRDEGLIEVLPELAELLGDGALEDGTFGAALRATLRLRRRSPTDFDLSNGFGAEVELSDVALRAGPVGEAAEGEVLAGVDSVWIDLASVRPRSGDVHVKTVEIERPALRVLRTDAGVHALGLLVKVPAPGSAPEERAATTGDEAAGAAGSPPAVAAVEAATAAGPAAEPPPEFRLDELLVSGIAFVLRDETSDPPVVLPFADLDVEVKRFTTRAFVEPRPVQFQAIVTGGEIPLPERDESAFLTGFASAMAGALGGGGDEYETELRPAFDEIALSGRLTFAPALRGWVKLAVSAFELPNFRGAAEQTGVEIGDGVVDTKLTLRFLGEQGLRMRSDTTFGYLSLSEPPNGPISQYLKLPAPLDVVLFVLRNRSGEHDIPVNLSLPGGQVSASAVAGAVAATVGQLVSDALAGSPFRMLGSLTDVVGLTGGEEVPVSAASADLVFEPGAAAVAPDARAELADLVERLNADGSLVVVVQHEFGGGDVEHAAVLANPSEEDCLALAARLRRARTRLSRERDQLAAETRARYAVGLGERARADTEELRRLDREIGRTEQALDRVYELLRPGAERRRDKRTRGAALALGELRLEAVRDLLESAGIRNARARIDLRRPRYQIVAGSAGGRVTLTPKRRE